jgi:hypothetical protein
MRTRLFCFAPMLSVVVAANVIAACAGDPLPLSHAANDPSNPNAPEAPPTATLPQLETSTKTPGVPASSTEHSGHTHPSSAKETSAPDAGVVYACPMHPEVRANAPGNCPKCGMTLVPK